MRNGGEKDVFKWGERERDKGGKRNETPVQTCTLRLFKLLHTHTPTSPTKPFLFKAPV